MKGDITDVKIYSYELRNHERSGYDLDLDLLITHFTPNRVFTCPRRERASRKRQPLKTHLSTLIAHRMRPFPNGFDLGSNRC
jgi:hypothetical protein